MSQLTDMVKSRIEREKLIAIVRGVEKEKCLPVARALYEGGVRVMEFSFDQAAPETWEETASAIGSVKKEFSGKMTVGAGTVTSTDLVQLAAKNGAEFIVSPNADPAVISKTKELGLVSVPGAMTPGEVLFAHESGADFVKVFPAGVLGTAYFKALTLPLNHIKMLAVAGITERSAAQFLSAGAVGLGVSGELLKPEWIAAGDYEKITEASKRMIFAIKGL